MTFILPGGLGQLKPAGLLGGFDPSALSNAAVLSNNNRTLSSISNGAMAVGFPSAITSPRYFEVMFSNPVGASIGLSPIHSAGLAASVIPGSIYPVVGGQSTWGWGLVAQTTGWNVWTNGTMGSLGASGVPAAGDVVGVALDQYGQMYFRRNAIWLTGNSTNFPSYGDGGGAGSPAIRPAATVSTSGTATLNTTGPFAFPPPTGYVAWG